MGSHTEIHLETEICEHLKSNGWLYELDDASKYDRARALFPDDVQAWVRATQPNTAQRQLEFPPSDNSNSRWTINQYSRTDQVQKSYGSEDRPSLG